MSNSKILYSEEEAAEKLGVSTEQLRRLVREHILKDGAEEASLATYQSSDLLVLRFLTGMSPQARAAHR